MYLLLAIAAVGHVVFWAAAVNRVHGIGIHRRVIDAWTVVFGGAMAAIPLAIAVLFWQRYRGRPTFGSELLWHAAWGYIVAAAAFAAFAAAERLWRSLHPERRGSVAENHTRRVALSAEAGRLAAPGVATWCSRIPLNEVFDLQVHEKHLVLQRWPAVAAEVRIAHVSDLHMSGRILPAYFERACDEVNRLEPDLILITGDLVDREDCVAWLPGTVGRLRAPHGVYYVRGNHDRRIRQEPLIKAMEELGIVHLGGTWRQTTVRGTPIVLAGNELPWFGPAPDCDELPPRGDDGLPLRILLAHGPDQFAWAQAHDFDLMLAGHNHGGQVRLPLLGAVLAPSLSGTRYSCGAFRRGNTVLHVSRGTGSLTPIRWNCPPEIALLTLCAAHIAPGH